MSSKSKPSGTTTTIQNTEPWSAQKPYLEDIFSQARSLYNYDNPEYYPYSTYATTTPEQSSALTRMYSTSFNDLTPGKATNFSSGLLGGDYLNINPGANTLGSYAINNLGLAAPGQSALDWAATNKVSDLSPGADTLKFQAANNFNSFNPGVPQLQNIANVNAASLNPGKGALQWSADNNATYSSPGTAPLQDVANTNVALSNPGRSALLHNATNNVAWDAPGNDVLNNIAWNSTVGGTSDLSRIAGGSFDNYADPTLNHFAKVAADNPGSDALKSYSSGDRLAVGNPYLDAVSESVLSRVVPQIQSQFINSGTLTSPEAARATTEGAASALAPFAFNQYQTEEQNQINAANALADQSLQSRGLQQSAAQALSNSLLQGGTLQRGAASDLANALLQARGLQQTSAAQLAGNYMQGAGMSADAAKALGEQYLQGAGLSSDAAKALTDQFLSGVGLQQQAGTTLGNQYLQGAGLQEQAANALGNQFYQGAGLQQQAGTTLGNQFLTGVGLSSDAGKALAEQALTGRGLEQTAANNQATAYNNALEQMVRGLAVAPQTQEMQYTPWTNLYNAGATQQNLNQAYIDDAVAKWNWYQNLPYDKLNYFLNAVNGNYGSTSSRTDPYYINRTSNALSGGLGGASVGSSLFGPVGGVLGGGLGLISSFF